MNLEGAMLSEISLSQKGKYLSEVSRIAKYIEVHVEWWLTEARGGRNGEFLFNRNKVPVLQNE